MTHLELIGCLQAALLVAILVAVLRSRKCAPMVVAQPATTDTAPAGDGAPMAETSKDARLWYWETRSEPAAEQNSTDASSHQSAPPSHDVEILKHGQHWGWRPDGHHDIAEALATEGLAVRWPDGRIQERPE